MENKKDGQGLRLEINNSVVNLNELSLLKDVQ